MRRNGNIGVNTFISHFRRTQVLTHSQFEFLYIKNIRLAHFSVPGLNSISVILFDQMHSSITGFYSKLCACKESENDMIMYNSFGRSLVDSFIYCFNEV